MCLISPVPLSSEAQEIELADQARLKALALLSPPSPIQPLLFTELGTRRRRSFRVHDLVVQGLVKGSDEWKASNGKVGGLGGTSNVSLEMDVPIPILSTFEIHVSALIIVSGIFCSQIWPQDARQHWSRVDHGGWCRSWIRRRQRSKHGDVGDRHDVSLPYQAQ